MMFPFPAFSPTGGVGYTGIQFSARQNDTAASITMPKTFTAYDIGMAAANRLVIAVIYWNGGAGSQTLSSFTIGGLAATIHQSQVSASITPRCAIGSVIVPTGTTADVAITLSGTITGGSIHCAVWYGLTNTAAPLDSVKAVATVGADCVLTDVAVTSGGFVVAGFAVGVSATITPTWSGVDAVTENFDVNISAALSVEGMCFNVTASTTTSDLTGDNTGGGTTAGVVASWSP